MPVDNTPAFPVNSDNYASPDSAAIDLRDYFAAKAIEGAASGDGGLPDSSYCQLIAKRAYEIADAMLKARGQA